MTMNHSTDSSQTNDFAADRWVYANYGGIGFSQNPLGKIDGVAGHESEQLRIVEAPTGREIFAGHKIGGWTEEALKEQLALLEPQIKESGWADAYLGPMWLGSTEI